MLPPARIALAILAAALIALPAPAHAARRSVPQQFMGANWDGPITAAPDSVQQAEFQRMATAGVETVRTAFMWAQAQPQEGGPIDLSATDKLVAMASAHRIRVLPEVILAPPWARQSDAALSPPRDPQLIVPYVQALIARYGASGSFWPEHPELPKLPIREWQFWNEPHLQFQWTIPQDEDWAASYVPHLRVFYRTVKAADPHAKVVLAGLSNRSPNYLNDLYRKHAHGLFDIAAIHPYTVKPAGVAELVRRFRAVMKHHGDGRKPLWVTEFGLPASKGKSSSDNTLQTTDSGMARFLTAAYGELARTRRNARYGASRAYWYTWASQYSGDIFTFTGLLRFAAGDSAPTAQPAYRSYVSEARRLEGCVKTTSGTCR